MNIITPEILLLIVYLVAHTVFLTITIANYLTVPTLGNIKKKNKFEPLISILVPARNEEKTLPLLLDSLLKQTYKNIEILVLNDNSSDRTPNVVMEYEKVSDKIKLIEGEPLPDDWLGKNFACHQLSTHAKGEILLFVDADVILSENSVENSFAMMDECNVVMLSVFPSQIFKSFGEWILVPMMNWLLLNFLVVRSVYTSTIDQFTAANGQFIMVGRKVYRKYGGHKSVRKQVVEDMELARLFKSNGEKILAAVGGESVYANMYHGFMPSFNGFSKNFFPGFKTPVWHFLTFLVLVIVFYLMPYIFVLKYFAFISVVALIMLQRIFISLVSRQNVFLNMLLHPLQIIALYVVGISSLINTKTGNIKWKGRKIN